MRRKVVHFLKPAHRQLFVGLIFCLTLQVGLSACGVFTGTGFLDPQPAGTMLTRVPLVESGNPAAGFVSVWRTSTRNYTVRFESLDLTTSEPAVQIRATINGAGQFIGNLRGFSGTQNYRIQVTNDATTWVAVTLHRTGNFNVTVANATMSASYP